MLTPWLRMIDKCMESCAVPSLGKFLQGSGIDAMCITSVLWCLVADYLAPKALFQRGSTVPYACSTCRTRGLFVTEICACFPFTPRHLFISFCPYEAVTLQPFLSSLPSPPSPYPGVTRAFVIGCLFFPPFVLQHDLLFSNKQCPLFLTKLLQNLFRT